MMPPAKFHEPVAALSARAVPVSTSVPVRLTVPPLRWKLPRAAGVKPPPRVTVLLVAAMVPWFDHPPELLPRGSAAPGAVMAEPAALVQEPERERLAGDGTQALTDDVTPPAEAQACGAAAEGECAE